MLTRRAVVAAFGGVWCLSHLQGTLAQQPKIYRIGYLANDTNPRKQSETFAAFVAELQKLGWVEGKNIEIRERTSLGIDARFVGLAEELVHEKVDVIVAGGSAATRAAMAATQQIPIVFGSAADPEKQKFVASLNRPGGNVTGLALMVRELGPKRIEYLGKMLPRATRFARLYQSDSIAAIQPAIIAEDEAAARERGVTLHQLPVKNVDNLEPAFASAVSSGIEGLIVTAAGLFVGNRERIASLGVKYRLPLMCTERRFTKAGALMSYGDNFIARYRRAAAIVDQVLRGTKPAQIPVDRSAVFDFAINLATARQLGIVVPDALLSEADWPVYGGS